MGQQQSANLIVEDRDKDFFLSLMNNQTTSLKNFQDNMSTFKGAASSDNDEVSSSYTSKDTTVVENERLRAGDGKKGLIPYKFEWKYGGNEVYIVGSFANWNQRYLMNKTGENHVITLLVPFGVNQFKFIKDGEWMYSTDYITCNDGRGNINNILEVTSSNLGFSLRKEEVREKSNQLLEALRPNFILGGLRDKQPDHAKLVKEEKESDGKRLSQPENNETQLFTIEKGYQPKYESRLQKDNTCSSYPCSFPNRQEAVNLVKQNALKEYRKSININYNSTQLKKFNRTLLRPSKNSHTTVNSSFNDILRHPHTSVNHIHIKSSNINNDDFIKGNSSGVLESSVTSKIRNKNYTIHYYCPI